MSNKLVKALPIYVSNSGCDYHRIRLPFMAATGLYDGDFYKGFTIDRILEYMEQSDVIVFNRTFYWGIEKLQELKRKGVKVVMDLDDHWELPWQHPLYRQYKEKTGPEIITCLKEADVVTVTTERLATKARLFNSNVHVIPNALPFGVGQFTERPARQDDTFNVIYAGQSSHLEDVRTLINPFKRIKQLPGLGFQLAGWTDQPVWNAMEKVFSRMPNYQRIEQRALIDYMSVYDKADCMIVPLTDNSFNWHKSNLKLLEAAAKKLPVVCSHVPPYSDCSEAPVLWVKKQSDWYENLRFLSENRNEAARLGIKMYEWAVNKYNLSDWNALRFQIINT